MKKYLLATSAIVGSLFAFAGQASAQTTVTADMHLTYSAISNKGSAGAADKAGSYRGFGKETQLNIKHVGKLNNGAGYVAGFSIEHDGNDKTLAQNNGTQATSTQNSVDISGMFNENVYMDFIFGNTTLTVGADHIQNPDFTYTNLAGFRADPEDILDGVGKSNTGADNLYAGSATTRYGSFGAGIIQDLGIAKVSYYYVPGGTPSAETGVGTTPLVAAEKDATETGHEFMARGNLGVKGLDATLFYSTQDSEGATAKDAIGRMVGAKYNFGSITVGAELKRNTSAAAVTTESRSGAIGYAIDKNLTVAAGLMEAERKQPGALGLTEDTKFLQVGYNLGPVAAGLAYVTADNIGGTQGNEAKGLYFQLSSAF
jgi:hypothetical protein